MRSIPMITGVLTIGLLGTVGAVLLSEGAWLIGGLALGFAVLRLVLFILQLVRIARAKQDEAPADYPASPDE